MNAQTRSTDPRNQLTSRLLILMILLSCLVAILTIRPQAVRAAVGRMESVLSGGGPATRTHTSPHPQAAKTDSRS